MSIVYPTKNRLYSDGINSNNRWYRESEAHAKITTDRGALIVREGGFDKQIYEDMHDPDAVEQDIQAKLYKSE